MSGAPLWELALGPFAALVLCLVILYATFRLNLIVPQPYYEASEKRNAVLEEESEKLNALVMEHARRLGDSRVLNAELKSEVKHLTNRVEELTRTVETLTQEIEKLREDRG